MRSAKEWHEYGYKTLFRHGQVFLYRTSAEIAYVMSVDGGRWMEYGNVNRRPWKFTYVGNSPDLAADFHATAQLCYCSLITDVCDFCSGIREARHAEANSQPAAA